MKEIIESLKAISDEKYAAFEAKLAPTVGAERCLGVRVPDLRKFAKELGKSPICAEFLDELPHFSYDENLLHSIILCHMNDYSECLGRVEKFLPYIDNWAACDTLRPKCFKKHLPELLPKVLEWVNSEKTYTCRFGIDMLMTYYLGDEYSPEFNRIVAEVKSDEYYVKMMAAWYFATALIDHWEDAVGYISERRLPEWTRKKAIQKAVESNRITTEQKEYLKILR